MASAAEQLAANLSWSTFSKAKELQNRILFTLAILIVYRAGTFITLPGIDSTLLEQFMARHRTGILGVVDAFAGGAVGRMAVFALGIMPYISASIIMQLLTTMVPSLEALKKEGESGRKKINQYTRYGTVLLAVMQAYGVAIGFQGTTMNGQFIVPDQSSFFVISAVISLVGGTVLLMWLGEQITARGVGNGISLIIFVGIIAGLPVAISQFLDQSSSASSGAPKVIGVTLLAVGLIAFVVFVERAQRRIAIQYPQRNVGNKVYQGDRSHLPLKVNTAGVIPPIFATSLLAVPTSILAFQGGSTDPANPAASDGGVLQEIALYMQQGSPLYLITLGALIIFFCFFYTAIVFNPEEVADNLKKHGGFVPGVRPGKRTAEYLDFVLTRLTVVGAVYLTLVCVIPVLLHSNLGVPFYLGGTSLLIVVSVTMDTISQVQSHLLAHQYEGLIKKSKLRGRKR